MEGNYWRGANRGHLHSTFIKGANSVCSQDTYLSSIPLGTCHLAFFKGSPLICTFLLSAIAIMSLKCLGDYAL